MNTMQAPSKLLLRNILLATDFSQASDSALRYALPIARRYDAHLYVAHVIRPDAYQLVPADALTTVQGQARRYAEQEMTNVLVSGRLRGVPHQVLLKEGEIWPALSQMVEEQSADLVVVGTHGRTGVRKLLLGSVAEEIFRLSQCPVLTVGPHAQVPASDEADLRHILYATDFTPASERAATFAFSLAQEHQARLTLLHIIQDVSVTETSAHAVTLVREFFQRRLVQMIPEGAEQWCEPDCEIEFGKPATEILRVAAEKRVDLLVLGVRQTGTFPGHLPPATAYQVVCQAPCPVLTVRG